MNNAELYASYHGLPNRDVTQVLSEYTNSMRWKTGDRVLDLGCGSGCVTSKLLLPRLPADFELLVGLDVSSNMIKYARKAYTHPKLRFEEFDLSKDTSIISEMWPEGFDKVFSFFCLHWIPDQRKVVSNIYNFLRTGGETLLVFLGKCPVFETYEILSRKPEWQPYMKDYHQFISPYQHSSDPGQEFRKLLQDTGFDVIECECRDSVYSYENASCLKDSIKAVNPFIDRIPTELQEQYLTEITTELIKIKMAETNNNTEDGVLAFKYGLTVAHARKV